MGGNLGGLAGADKHCQALAAKAGAANRTWRAYLSTSMPDVNARDRIGSGPDEQGRSINAQGAPNRHDILTGSTVGGKASTTTCGGGTLAGRCPRVQLLCNAATRGHQHCWR